MRDKPGQGQRLDKLFCISKKKIIMEVKENKSCASVTQQSGEKENKIFFLGSHSNTLAPQVEFESFPIHFNIHVFGLREDEHTQKDPLSQ